MKVAVRGTLRDLLAFFALRRIRARRMAGASAEPLPEGGMNRLAGSLHPDSLDVVITAIRTESSDTRTYRLARNDGSRLPYFRAGQYVCVKLMVEGVHVSRPYTISSTPDEALDDGYYEITIRKVESGFLTPYIWERWDVGTEITVTGPHGTFYYEPIRDRSDVVCIAGGCGITPFKAMIPDLLDAGAEVTLLYGITNPDDVIFGSFYDELQKSSSGRLQVVYVNSGTPQPDSACEEGLISHDLITRHVASHVTATYFICGPEAMTTYLRQELRSIKHGRLRFEVPGDTRQVAERPDFPAAYVGKSFSLTVRAGDQKHTVRARSEETVLSAIEGAGLAPRSECRSGTCGYCRSKLISGDFYGIKESDGTRQADRKFGYFHPCASYPLSDMEISVPTE